MDKSSHNSLILSTLDGRGRRGYGAIREFRLSGRDQPGETRRLVRPGWMPEHFHSDHSSILVVDGELSLQLIDIKDDDFIVVSEVKVPVTEITSITNVADYILATSADSGLWSIRSEEFELEQQSSSAAMRVINDVFRTDRHVGGLDSTALHLWPDYLDSHSPPISTTVEALGLPSGSRLHRGIFVSKDLIALAATSPNTRGNNFTRLLLISQDQSSHEVSVVGTIDYDRESRDFPLHLVRIDELIVIGNRYSGFRVFAVSDEGQVRPLGSYITGSPIDGMAVKDDRLYIATRNNLLIYIANDTGSFQQISSMTLEDEVTSACVSDEFILYVGVKLGAFDISSSNSLLAFETKDPLNMRLLQHWSPLEIPGRIARSLCISDEVYLGTSHSGLFKIEIREPDLQTVFLPILN